MVSDTCKTLAIRNQYFHLEENAKRERLSEGCGRHSNQQFQCIFWYMHMDVPKAICVWPGKNVDLEGFALFCFLL